MRIKFIFLFIFSSVVGFSQTIETAVSKKEIKIAIKNGFIQLLSLQLPGKKRMQVAELLNGITFSDEAKVY